MHLLFAAVGGHGHLHPLLPIAEAARRAGHEVLVTAAASLGDHVRSRGLPFEPSGPDLRPVHSDLVLRSPAEERGVLRTYFAGDLAHRRASDLLALLRRWPADVVVRDEVDFGAAVAAEVVGRPQAVVVVLAAGGFLVPDLVREPLASLRSAVGLPAAGTDAMLLGDLVLAPFPAAFRDEAHPLVTGTIHYRPESASQAPPGQPGAPRGVHVTLGTIYNTESGDLLARLARGAAAATDRVTVATGSAVDPRSLGVLPSHVAVERFVDQPAVLASSRAVVSHAGSGTVLDALRLGVPQVCVPLGADQLLNARRCEALGVGVVLDPRDLDPASVTAAVRTVLTDPAYARAARRLRQHAEALPDVSAAVAAFETLPVRRGRAPGPPADR